MQYLISYAKDFSFPCVQQFYDVSTVFVNHKFNQNDN